MLKKEQPVTVKAALMLLLPVVITKMVTNNIKIRVQQKQPFLKLMVVVQNKLF